MKIDDVAMIAVVIAAVVGVTLFANRKKVAVAQLVRYNGNTFGDLETATSFAEQDKLFADVVRTPLQ